MLKNDFFDLKNIVDEFNSFTYKTQHIAEWPQSKVNIFTPSINIYFT